MATVLTSDAVSTPPVVADTLALALVAASDAPILLLDGHLTVIAASASFVRAFQIDPETTNGRSLSSLGAGEWNIPQLRSLLRVTLSGAADVGGYEMDLQRAGREARRLVITAHRLDHSDTHDTRLLLAVSDVTDARLAERLKDDLLREKALLYQELQHRVANSLQIIAVVLMQSARRAGRLGSAAYLLRRPQPGHVRGHPSAAAHHLASRRRASATWSTLPSCVKASMRVERSADHDKLRLKVEVDESLATPDVSISLGLIVTELVINALKHAFPLDASGDILVSYRSSATGWTLSVSDNGVGMPSGSAAPQTGLGTSIIEAMAKQRHAIVHLADYTPGALVSIVHEGPAEA